VTFTNKLNPIRVTLSVLDPSPI